MRAGRSDWPGGRPGAEGGHRHPRDHGDVGRPTDPTEGVGGSVIVRTGRRIPAFSPWPRSHPIVVVRMAVGDAYGAEEGRTERRAGPMNGHGGPNGSTVRCAGRWPSTRFVPPPSSEGCVDGGPKWTVSTVYEGMLKEEMDAAAARHPDGGPPLTPIHAAYAGLLTESDAQTLVIPALNRDGDCLSDSSSLSSGRSPAPSLSLLALDDALRARVVAMAEAPHGTAPSLDRKNRGQPDGHAPWPAAAVLDQRL